MGWMGGEILGTEAYILGTAGWIDFFIDYSQNETRIEQMDWIDGMHGPLAKRDNFRS
jgi:hypothetical protein